MIQPDLNFDTPRPVPTNGTDTSQASALELAHSGARGLYRKQIHGFIADRGAAGATCDEVEVCLGIRHQTASCFLSFLRDDNFIKDSGTRRPTRTGRKAIVWVTA